jgi:uncharacterized protein (TIGR01244 family)
MQPYLSLHQTLNQVRETKMHKVSDKLLVSRQLDPSDIEAARQMGVSAIINNRPDGEEPGQPAAAAHREIAEAKGLDYAHVPMAPGQVTLDKVRAFQEALHAAPGPVLAHCKTGTRSATLFAIGEVLDGRMSRSDVLALGDRIGLDLSGALKWLDLNAS